MIVESTSHVSEVVAAATSWTMPAELTPMHQRQRVVAIVGAMVGALVVFELVRRRKLREEYSWIWIAAAGIVSLLALNQPLLIAITILLVAVIAALLAVAIPVPVAIAVAVAITIVAVTASFLLATLTLLGFALAFALGRFLFLLRLANNGGPDTREEAWLGLRLTLLVAALAVLGLLLLLGLFFARCGFRRRSGRCYRLDGSLLHGDGRLVAVGDGIHVGFSHVDLVADLVTFDFVVAQALHFEVGCLEVGVGHNQYPYLGVDLDTV